MTTKGIILALFIGLFSFTSHAQDSTATADSEAECKKWRGLYYTYLKQKMYPDSDTMWRKAIDACGADNLDAKFYKNGRVIYTKLMSANKENAELFASYKTQLFSVYDQKMKIEDDPVWTADYASLMISHKEKDFDKIDDLFAKSIHTLKSDAKSTHIKQYFKHLIINKFNTAAAEEKEAIRGKIIEEYIVLSDYSSTALKKYKIPSEDPKVKASNDKNVTRFEGTIQFLDKYFLKIAKDCAVLTPVLDKKFESLPEEKEARLAEVNKFMTLLDKQKCTDSETYEKFVRESVNLNPTGAGYYGLGNVLSGKSDIKGATEAFKKAVEAETETGENFNKYQFAYATSLYKSGSYKSAFSNAKKVQGDDRGKALEICAGCIVKLANSCGESTFARKANYWLANDYIVKAGGSSSKYLDSAPTDEEIFNEGKTKGSSISLSCWGESTTIR